MTAWNGILAEVLDDKALYLVGLFLVTLVLARLTTAPGTVRFKALGFFFGLYAVLVPVTGVMRSLEADATKDVRLACLILGALAAVGMAGVLLFDVLLPRVRLRTPRVLQDVVLALSSLIAVLGVASKAGFNLSGLIATSAVLTAVIGFSLQETLGNVIGGLALQMDPSVGVGDWVKVADVAGRITEIRWRYTAIETRNWETVIIPNSMLMKNPVQVLGRRSGKPLQWRRWVYFNVDFRHQPSDVIEAVTTALKSSEIERMAADPPPNCVLMDLHESYARYAVRYWLTDLAADDPTDSVVRTWVYFALKRGGMSLSIPASAVFVTQESHDRKAAKSKEDLLRRMAWLNHEDLFSHLDEDDRNHLAASLRYAPFTKGEVITRQGAEAHWLYLIFAGEVSVRVTAEGGLEREVARLSKDNFFGEMSLMTGEKRAATVVALTDVECYRLDKGAFQEIIEKRPELAEHVAELLAKRRIGLIAAREGLDHDASARRLAADKTDLVKRIRSFFGLADDAKRPAS